MTDQATAHRQNHGTTLKLLVAFCVGLLVFSAAGAAVQPALAQDDDGDDEEDGLLDTMFADDSDLSWSDRVRVGIGASLAATDRFFYGVSSRIPGNEPTPVEEHAEDLTEEFNDHSEAYQSYVNARFNGDESDYGVIKVVLEKDDETAVRYLEADISDVDGDGDRDFVNARMVEETQWEPDGTITLEDYAAANAAQELGWFRQHYVEEDTDVDTTLRRRAANKYLGLVELDGSVDYNVTGGA